MAEDGRASERGHCLGALFLIPLVMVRLAAGRLYRIVDNIWKADR
jgi:hypothetical protein